MDTYFQGIWRMDWGLGNPNKTAALIATLMVGIWALALIRRVGFWIALTLFIGLGVCLIHTFSRGGLIALVAGLGLLLWQTPRPWPRSRVVGGIAAFWIILGASVYLQAANRFGQGIAYEDKSITSRLNIWKVAPRMMVDAPGGWGIGNSGRAYMEWYQALDRHEEYRTLVNSHLTWLVEVGWPLRFLYLLAWAAIFVLCWPDRKLLGARLALGIWCTFAVSAFFSSVAESPWLWSAPAISLLAVLAGRLVKRDWPSSRTWLFSFGAVAALTLLLFIAGVLAPRECEIRASSTETIVGHGEPSVWVVSDGKTVGQHPGRGWRELLAANTDGAKIPTLAILSSLRQAPSGTGMTLVVAGDLTPEEREALGKIVAGCSKLILLNPTYYPQEVGPILSHTAKVSVAFGEFSQSGTSTAWSTLLRVDRLEGVGDFLPRWPDLIVHAPHT